jgi:hypothetical protein
MLTIDHRSCGESNGAARSEVVLLDDDETARATLISTLVDVHDLPAAARDACRVAGVRELEDALQYCLVVLAQKRDAERYGLDEPQAEDFPVRLAEQAATVAGFLRDWSATYRAIREEGDHGVLATLRGFIRTRTGDDAVDRAAMVAGDLLNAGVPVEEMTLALARAEEPAGSEYVFQSPLDAWIGRVVRQNLPRDTDPLEDDDVQPKRSLVEDPPREVVDEVTDAVDAGEEVLQLLSRRVSELLATRELLASLIDRADGFEVEFARMRPASRTHDALVVRLRATITDLADRLRREQRALRDALAYVVLGLGRAHQQQGAAILSLRNRTIDPEAITAMAETMHAMLTDVNQPTPALITRARAADAEVVPAARALNLTRVRDEPQARPTHLAAVRSFLETAPERVHGLQEIAAAMPVPCTTRVVAVNRGTMLAELRALDRWMGAAYGRYTAVTA